MTSFASVNFASDHRPRSFKALTGQQHVVAILRQALLDERVPQQLLFSGGSGLGKTTVARIVAAALLCTTPVSERQDAEPCGRCPSCSAIMEDRHPDLIEFDAASNGGKDEIRELAARAQVTPLLSTRRIYIIDEAHGLSAPGGQAFLKLLEEPPGHVIFMLCTTDPQKMLKTNRGRCTEFELLPPSRAELLRNLEGICARENWIAPSDVLELVIDSTDPDLGVRGTVNSLSKLAPLMRSGQIDEISAAALLGRAPLQHVDQFIDAALNGLRLRVIDELATLRATASDEAIRSTMTDRIRSRYIEALKERSAAGAHLLRMFEELVTLPRGRQWLDLYAYRSCDDSRSVKQPDEPSIPSMASPQGNAGVGQTARVSSAVSRPVEQIQQSAPRTPTTTNTPAVSTAGPTNVPAPVQASVATPAKNTDVNATKRTDSSSIPSNSTPDDKVSAFISAVAQQNPDLAGALRRCAVTVDDEISISTTADLHREVSAGARTLRSVAGRAGLAITIRRG